MTQKIIRVAVPSPLQRCFDYTLPNHYAQPLQAGMRVSVPFGKRKLVGVILDIVEQTDVKPERLRNIYSVLDSEPIFDTKLFELLSWASQYYQYPIGEVFSQALPILLRQGESTTIEPDTVWQATTAAANAVLTRSPKQRALLDTVQQHPDGLSEHHLRTLGFEARLWQQLAAKGYIQRIVVESAAKPSNTFHPAPHALNSDQQAAVEAINQANGTFKSFLLEGVTGSGKTEVYLKTLEHVLAQGKQALVLVPEIALTPQTVARFAERFDLRIGVLHSGLTDKERLKTWKLAKDGDISLIIGTRSAIFTAFNNLGIIIIDEEHDASFKQQDNFRYSARDIAIRRAQLEQIPVVLGSATPALESLQNAKMGRYQLLSLPMRAGNAQQPTFHLVDMCRQRLQAGLTPAVLAAVHEHLNRGNQVLLFLNRRGFATALLCHDCGWSAQCKRCEVPMTLHQDTQRLHCHHCDARQLIPKICPQCQSKQLLNLGIGTERLEIELTALFADREIIRIDRDSTRRKGSMAKKLNAIHASSGQILIGTQMLAKGHHFPNVTLVVMLNADQGLLSTDFRATERVGQLLIQVAGRSGREDKPGTVLIQTHQPQNPLLIALTQRGYSEFAHELLLERQAAHFPPFSFLVLLRAESVHASAAEKFLQHLRDTCQELNIDDRVQTLGPIPAPMPKRAGKHRAQLLLRANQRSDLQKILQPLRQYIETLKNARQVRWSIDVDPQE